MPTDHRVAFTAALEAMSRAHDALEAANCDDVEAWCRALEGYEMAVAAARVAFEQLALAGLARRRRA